MLIILTKQIIISILIKKFLIRFKRFNKKNIKFNQIFKI